MSKESIPKYMQNDKLIIFISIAIISLILLENKILGDLMVFPLGISLLYLIATISYRSFIYLADNNSSWTRFILVISVLFFFLFFFFIVFLIDKETSSYLFENTNKLGAGFFYSLGSTTIFSSLLVLMHKVFTFIKNG